MTYNEYLQKLYEEDKLIIQVIDNEDGNTIVYRPMYEYDDNNWVKRFRLDKDVANDYTQLINSIKLESYDKYWADNHYVLKWNWHKDPDIVRMCYEYQQWEYYSSEEEFLNEVELHIKDRIKELLKKDLQSEE